MSKKMTPPKITGLGKILSNSNNTDIGFERLRIERARVFRPLLDELSKVACYMSLYTTRTR